jgi:serine/threonine protein kinase
MGTVYLGVSKTGVTAAVKVLHEGYSDNPVLRERLSREAETLSSLDSPHIAKLIETYEAKTQAVIAKLWSE